MDPRELATLHPADMIGRHVLTFETKDDFTYIDECMELDIFDYFEPFALCSVFHPNGNIRTAWVNTNNIHIIKDLGISWFKVPVTRNSNPDNTNQVWEPPVKQQGIVEND